MTDRAYGNGAWTGELHLVLLEDKASASTRERRQLWAVERPLTYRTRAGDTITPPPGFVTDLASIPRPFTALFVPSGAYTLAAVYHDYLCATNGTGVCSDGSTGVSRAKPYTSAEAASILLEAMEDLNVGRFTRLCIWAAVRLFGPQWGT